MIKLLGIAVCVVFCSLVLRDVNKTFSLLLSVSGCVIIIVSVTGELIQLSSKLKEMLQPSSSFSYLKLMLRVLALTLLTQGVSNICRDNGENALAGVCEFGAKVAVTALILPLFETVIQLVGGMIK